MPTSKSALVATVVAALAVQSAAAQTTNNIRPPAARQPAGRGNPTGGGSGDSFGGGGVDALGALGLGLALFHAARAAHPTPTRAPVYELVPPGPPDVQIQRLSKAFNLPPESLHVENGGIGFIDTNAYLAIPRQPLADPRREAIDFDALSRLRSLDPVQAERMARAGFAAAGYVLDAVRPVVSHNTLSAVYDDGGGRPIQITRDLDTRVAFTFTAGGIPIIGPGAQLEVTFGPSGAVTHLRAAGGTPRAGGQVNIVPENAARDRAPYVDAPNTQNGLRLVYWAATALPGDESASSGPTALIPWYAVSQTTPLTGRSRGGSAAVTAKVTLIPATDDARFVPTARLQVSGAGTSQVAATVTVTGGRAPYSYHWTGSNPELTRETAAAVQYAPRASPANAPAAGTSTQWVETVGVTVTDANGVSVVAQASLKVLALLVAAHAEVADAPHDAPTYAVQSPREPTFSVDRLAWQKAMAAPGAGGGVQAYERLGAESWPGDFIAPSPRGTIPDTPWINGDADTRGINTAAMVLNNTDGFADGFAAAEPSSKPNAYATAQVRAPSAAQTVLAGLVNYHDAPGAHSYSVDLTGSWGGPNSHLLWLLMDACDTLDAVDSAGLTPAQRWGKAFGGLHMMTGWASPESVGDGSFERIFVENMLGAHGPPQTVFQAWFNAAVTVGPEHGVAAAMGPIGPGGVDDKGDYYLGKGSQGPTLLPADIKGFWYIHQ